MQKPFDKDGFPARIGPVSYLGLAFTSQTGMSFVQQGLVILGTFLLAVYHLSLTELGFVTTALSLGVMCSMVFAGIAVDRLGPRVVLFYGTLLMALFGLMLTQVHSFDILLLMLFFVGVSLAIVPAAGTKAVFTAFSNRPRGLVMGIRQTGVPVGAALAAWLLPQMVPHVGLNLTYVVFALELLVVGFAFSFVIPHFQRAAAKSLRVRLEKNHWRLLARPVGVAFLMVSGQYILLTYSIVDLHRQHHLSLATAGIILAVSQLGGGVGRILLGQISDRMGQARAPVLAIAGTVAAALALVIGFLPVHVPVFLLFVLWTVFGFGAVGWNALALTWAGETVPPSHSGMAMSLTGSVVFLGSSVFPPLFGWIVDTSHHFAFGWWMLSLVLGVAASLSWFAAIQGKKDSLG